MEVLTSQLPSGGFGYEFSSVSIKPMNFLEITNYIENVPKDNLEKYLFDIKVLAKDDPKIYDCYIMDVDFLIFYKKLITVSEDMSYEISVKCSECGKLIKKKINISSDIHFKQIDDKIMKGAIININDINYDVAVPTVREFLKVFETYLRYKKVTDLNMIKTISLIKNFDINGNQIEEAILGAKHKDITLLMALRELYFDRLEPIEIYCPECSKTTGERRGMTVSVDSLIVDFFRELYNNCPIDGSKILFK